MIQQFFNILAKVADFIWAYPAMLLIVSAGLFFCWRSRLFQIRKFPAIVVNFFHFIRKQEHDTRGVHPLKAFFASLGGSIGLGNVVVICAAIQIGGPGAIFWTWVTGLLGMLLKYGEVYLGMRFRVKNADGSYDGGPMYFLPKAFEWRFIPIFVAILLCIYGAEVFVFSEITGSIADNWEIPRTFVMVVLLILVLIAGLGGVRRVGEISGAVIPIFVVLYLLMCVWVLSQNIERIPDVIRLIFQSAFTGHAPIGAFAGATWILSMSQGAARGCYSGDVGIGYAAVIHSESSTHSPGRQSCLAIFGIFLDTFVICTLSVVLILITDVWDQPINAGVLVQTALGQYFPYMKFFMPFFLLLLGYSTLIAYFLFGLKSAAYLSPRYGRAAYSAYAAAAMILFSFVDSMQAFTVMTVVGGILLLVNVSAIWKLHHEICFTVD